MRFGNMLRNEDMPFTKIAIALSESVYYCKKTLYLYVQHSNSLMHNENLLDERNSQIAISLVKEKIENYDYLIT